MRRIRAISILTLTFASTVAHPAWAQPSAEEVLAAADFSDAEKQRITAGELVSGDLKAPYRSATCPCRWASS